MGEIQTLEIGDELMLELNASSALVPPAAEETVRSRYFHCFRGRGARWLNVVLVGAILAMESL